MALFNLDIQKKLNTQFWTNRYVIDLPALSSTAEPIPTIVGAERAIHAAAVEFTSYRVSTPAPSDDQFVITPLGYFGLRAVGLADLLPLFDVARVDFQVPVGRPSRKYLRGVLAEGDQAGAGTLNQAVIDFINENYVGYIVAIGGYVDVDGQSITGGATYPSVGMRQLRRGSRRQTEPIIPVS